MVVTDYSMVEIEMEETKPERIRMAVYKHLLRRA